MTSQESADGIVTDLLLMTSAMRCPSTADKERHHSVLVTVMKYLR